MIPVIVPAGVQEFLDLGLHGWAMSRFAGLWAGFKCIGETVDSAATVTVDPERVQTLIPADFEKPEGGLNTRIIVAEFLLLEELRHRYKIGRASFRERVLQYVSISGVAGSLKKKNHEQIIIGKE